MSVLENIKQKLAAMEEQKKAMVAELQTEFPALFKELFEKSKLINTVAWTQYTPYFNDGDTCEFSVHSDDLYVNDEYADDLEWYSWKIKYNDYDEELKNDPNFNREESEIVREFSEIISSIPDEFLKDLFGDHARVAISRDGTVEVEEYDHD